VVKVTGGDQTTAVGDGFATAKGHTAPADTTLAEKTDGQGSIVYFNVPWKSWSCGQTQRYWKREQNPTTEEAGGKMPYVKKQSADFDCQMCTQSRMMPEAMVTIQRHGIGYSTVPL